MAETWVTVGDLAPGDLFETRDGRRWHRWWNFGDRVDARQADVPGANSPMPFAASEPVRPLTPVAVSPALPDRLRLLLLVALARGTDDAVGALADYLIETGADPDAARAVRARAVRAKALADAAAEADLWGQDAETAADGETRPARQRTARQLASMARHIGNAIRKLDTHPVTHG